MARMGSRVVTAAPRVRRAEPAGASSVLVAALEAAWSAIVSRHPQVPDAVIIVAPGSGHRANELKLGHFAAGRWDVGGLDRPEVLVGGEGLRRDPLDVQGTLLHEAAHGLGFARGIKDTSRGGRYHNQQYRRLAVEVGLDVAQDGTRGWSRTSVTDATKATYGGVLAQLSDALVLWRRAERHGGTGASRNPSPCSCDCGRRIRVAAGTFAEGPIVCGRCEGEFRYET
jgi:hypothetical protein